MSFPDKPVDDINMNKSPRPLELPEKTAKKSPTREMKALKTDPNDNRDYITRE